MDKMRCDLFEGGRWIGKKKQSESKGNESKAVPQRNTTHVFAAFVSPCC
jgi:hypothetical protein